MLKGGNRPHEPSFNLGKITNFYSEIFKKLTNFPSELLEKVGESSFSKTDQSSFEIIDKF